MAGETSSNSDVAIQDKASGHAVTPVCAAQKVTERSQTLAQLMISDVNAWLREWNPGRAADTPPTISEILHFWSNYCGLQATWLYRISHALKKKRIPLLPGFFTRLNIVLYGFDIPSSVPIGPGLYMPHPVGVTVMATRIGANVTLIGAITIGMRNKPIFPVIGDNVFIGAGARILGDISIGAGASIGANAVVLSDIPSGATAVGIPAKVRSPKAEIIAVE